MKAINLSYGKTLENKAQVDDNQREGSQYKNGGLPLRWVRAPWWKCLMNMLLLEMCMENGVFCCRTCSVLFLLQTVDETKKMKQKKPHKLGNISCVDKQTSLDNSGKTFANQHTVAPVKTCRLFPLWTPADTFLMPCLARRTFIQWITTKSLLFSW